MPGVDSSLYSSFINAQPQPLQQAAQGVGLLTSLKGYQAKLVAGRALQEATDSNGNVDYNRAINNYAADPQGQYGLGDFVNEQIQNQRLSTATAGEMLRNSSALQDIVSKAALGMAQNKNLQDGDIVNGVSTLYSNLHATGLTDKYPHVMDALMNIIPQLQGLPDESGVNRTNPLQPNYNPNARSKQQVLSQVGNQALSASENANLAYGNLVEDKTGANTVVSAISQLPWNAPRQVGVIPDQISPTTLQPTIGAGQQHGVSPLSTLVGQPPTGIQPPQGGGGQQTGTGTTPQGVNGAAQPTGVVQPPGATPTPPPPGATPTPPPPIPFIPTESSPAKVTAYNRFTDEFNQSTQALSSSQNALVQLKQAEGLLSQVKPGGGAEFRAKVGQVLQGLENTIPGLHIDPKLVDSVADGNLGDAQVFMKLAYWNALNQLHQNISSGRISTFETQMAASRNPSLDTDPRAIIKMNDLTNHLFQILQKKVRAMTFANNQWDQAQTNNDYKPVMNFDSAWDDYLSKQGWTNITPEANAARQRLWGNVGQ